MHGNAFDALDHDASVSFRQPAHHAHINPYDPAIPYFDVAGMGIGMEEAVIHDLLDEVIDEFTADLVQVIAVFLQVFGIVDGPAADILHD